MEVDIDHQARPALQRHLPQQGAEPPRRLGVEMRETQRPLLFQYLFQVLLDSHPVIRSFRVPAFMTNHGEK